MYCRKCYHYHQALDNWCPRCGAPLFDPPLRPITPQKGSCLPILALFAAIPALAGAFIYFVCVGGSQQDREFLGFVFPFIGIAVLFALLFIIPAMRRS